MGGTRSLPLPLPLPLSRVTAPGGAPEKLAFDSTTLPPAERMERYRALYGIGADVEQTGPAPRMTFEGWRLDRAIIYHRRLNDVSHSRTEPRVQRDGMTHWTVTLVFEGVLESDLGAGLRRLGPGDVILADVSQPGRSVAHDARIATLSIAQDRMEEVIGSIAGLHATILSPEHCRLYADFVTSLLANLPTMKAASLPSATSTLATLLKVALESQGTRDAVADAAREARKLTPFRTLVDARLSDPSFDANAAIRESGVSRATLYRLLQPGRGLASFIQERRMEKVRRSLSDSEDRRPFAAIALDAGFATESHASRVFLSRYGIRPSAYRATVAPTAGDADPIEQFRIWQQELR